jgi:hypothetical protein
MIGSRRRKHRSTAGSPQNTKLQHRNTHHQKDVEGEEYLNVQRHNRIIENIQM